MTRGFKIALFLSTLFFTTCALAKDLQLSDDSNVFDNYPFFASAPPSVPTSVSYYKLGIGAPVEAEVTIPSAQIGIGQRYHFGYVGADLSFSGNYMNALLVLDTAFELQGQALLFSHPHSESSFFLGFGLGYAWRQAIVPAYSESSSWTEFPTANALIGYEFNRFERFQQFLQLEFASHLCYENSWPNSIDTPSVIFSTGLTF